MYLAGRPDFILEPGRIISSITRSRQHPGLLRDKRATPTYTNISYRLPGDKGKGQDDEDQGRGQRGCSVRMSRAIDKTPDRKSVV